MHALFITGSDFSDETYGGPKASIRNYLLLSKYCKIDKYLVEKKSTFRSAITGIKGNFPPTDESDIKKVKTMYEEKQYPVVFLDGSTYGEFIDIFNKDITKIIVFFHNCEHDYISVRFGKKFSLKKCIYQYLNDKSEKKSIEMSDVRLVFSARDAERIETIYGKKADYIIPLSLVDKYQEVNVKMKENSCLLFGPVGSANIEAFQWFVREVSPYINCKTVVAGKGFENYKHWENEKVSVVGFVDSISDLYGSVSCVAIPLLSGGGMKIKTAEAMMFGKYIFGTDEAFSGYILDYDKVGGKCNSSEEFISKINAFLESESCKAFNDYSRNTYLEKYSVEATEAQFSSVMSDLGLQK